ncbi:hypothetical protein CKO27_13105, partial [Thiocystis violacea]|nr:hypothetical protein [Thiocystis violacea]
MSPHWTQQIARSLSTGRPTADLETHLDLLLVWLSHPDHPRAAELDRAIARQRPSRAQAMASAYRLLDRQFFESEDPPSPDRLGFTRDSEPAIAKQRYRRLMRVYHPDHHPDRLAWATRRTEQINRAFNAFRKGARAPARPEARERARASPRVADRPAWHPEAILGRLAAAWDWTRHRYSRLGPGQRWLLGGGTVTLLLILALLLQGEEPPKRMPRIIHHPLGTTLTSGERVDREAPAKPPPADEPLTIASTGPADDLGERVATARIEQAEPDSPETPQPAPEASAAGSPPDGASTPTGTPAPEIQAPPTETPSVAAPDGEPIPDAEAPIQTTDGESEPASPGTPDPPPAPLDPGPARQTPSPTPGASAPFM